MELPHYIQVTDKVKYGDSKLFRIRLNPKHKDDVGLIAHEYTHIKQWYAGFGIGLLVVVLMYLISGRDDYTYYAFCLSPFWKDLAYTLIKPARLFLEVQSVVAQIKRIRPTDHEDYYIKYFSESLAKDYGLSVSEEYVDKKIRKKLRD